MEEKKNSRINNLLVAKISILAVELVNFKTFIIIVPIEINSDFNLLHKIHKKFVMMIIIEEKVINSI